MLRHSVKLLISTIKHLRNGNQLLLIPLTIWSGLEQSFLGAQFTKVDQLHRFLCIDPVGSFCLGFCLLHIERQIRRFGSDCLWCL